MSLPTDLCTYCGQSGHTAGACNRRPRALALAAFVCLLLAACSAPPGNVPLPSAELMKPCPPLPAVPACEGERECRAKHYGETRAMYGRCADKAAGLQSHAATVAGKR